MPIQFLSLQGTGGSAVPYERRNAPYYLSSIATNPQDSLRLKRYEEHWRFYQGLQWSFAREDGEALVTANYCRVVVDKKASWLVGKGMVNEVPEALRERTKPVIDEVWEYNGGQNLLTQMATTGGVTGDIFMLIVYQPPSDAMKAVNPYTEGKTRLRLLGSHQVFPYWNPLNIEELLSVRIITEVSDFAPIQPGDDRRTPMTLGSIGVSRKRCYIEDIYPDKIIEGWDGADRVERPNDLGEIPLVHISNLSFPGEYYGLSDLDGIIDLQREFNEKMTDISDIVNYHSAPVTIITGAKAKNLERGPKSMWAGFPADAKVFNLELGSDLPAATKYLELVRQVLMDISGIPEGSLGRIQPVSNTSGVALQTQFQPLIEATDRKKPAFQQGVEKVNYFILRYNQLVKNESYPVDICKNCGGRIVEIEEETNIGKQKRRKCYLIDPQTLDFMKPDKVKLNWKRKLSYGTDTRLMEYKQIKKDFLKEGASEWDPGGEVDLQKKADEDHEKSRQLQAHHAQQAGDLAAHQATVSDQQAAASAKPTKPGETAPKPPGPTPPAPPEPGTTPPPKEIDTPPEVKPEQLLPHDIDVPEEPEEVDVTVKTWDANAKKFVEKKLGKLTIVPSGCERPVYLSPYTTKCKLRTPIPRDKFEDANLFTLYQKMCLVGRDWIRNHVDEEIDGPNEDKKIADDIPFMLAFQGMPDPAGGVAQTGGASPDAAGGDNNGAPNPPAPGPGRGNTKPGSPAAAKNGPQPIKQPANAKPGTKV